MKAQRQEPICLPNLAGQIQCHILTNAYKSCQNYAAGVAIAVLSSFAAARYRVEIPDVEELDIDNRSYVVHQGVMLVGNAGTGKGSSINTAIQLFHAIEDDACVVGFASQQAIWQRGERKPGTLWIMEHSNHLALVQREPKNAKQADRGISNVFVALQDSARNEYAMRPFYSASGRNPAYIPSSPITLLAESTSNAFQTKLPDGFAESYFYGKLLMVKADMPTHGDASKLTAPAPKLMEDLRKLSMLRGSSELIQVQWETDALAFFKWHLLQNEIITIRTSLEGLPSPAPSLHLMNDPVLNIAALLAIGVDHINPVISFQLVGVALELANASYDVMRSGLDVPPYAGLAH